MFNKHCLSLPTDIQTKLSSRKNIILQIKIHKNQTQAQLRKIPVGKGA